MCDEPLFQDIEDELFEVPTVAKLLALHDNYEPCVSEEEDVTSLVESARRELRQKFLGADIGISGANFLIADTGSFVTVNARDLDGAVAHDRVLIAVADARGAHPYQHLARPRLVEVDVGDGDRTSDPVQHHSRDLHVTSGGLDER